MKILFILFLIALMFTGCSENGTSMSQGEWRIQGVSQKGPFITGSTVNIMELDKKMLQTGKMFKSTIKSDKGDFILEGDASYSNYAMIEVNGYYRNEITGKKSSAPLTLKAITDISHRENVNVNLLTHLEYERVMYLVSNGKKLMDAKAQAEKEIISAMAMDESEDAFEDLDIFKSGDGNAKLLAISILLQGNEDVAGFTERIGKLALELTENGSWNDSVTRNAIAEWAFETEKYNEINDNNLDDDDMDDDVIFRKRSISEIRKNILAWGFSDSLPNFEKYINMFWADNYGLGKCSNANKGDTAVNVNSLSPYVGFKFVCDGTLWRFTYKGTSKYKGEYGTLTDKRDGHTYKTVQIGEQVWMAENLNYDYQTEVTHSMCYEYKQENCDAYGRLYTFAAAVDSAGLFGDGCLGCTSFTQNEAGNLKESSRGVCPEGWHLPSKGEWEQLFAAVGGKVKATTVLRTADVIGTDEYGFNAYSAGSYADGFEFGEDPDASSSDYWRYSDSPGAGNSCYWTSTPEPYQTDIDPDLRSTYLYFYSDQIRFQYTDFGFAFAVRCVKD